MTDETTNDTIEDAVRSAATEAIRKAIEPLVASVAAEATVAAKAAAEQPKGDTPEGLGELVQALSEQLDNLETELSSIRSSVGEWEYAKDQLSEIDEYIVQDADSTLTEAQDKLRELEALVN